MARKVENTKRYKQAYEVFLSLSCYFQPTHSLVVDIYKKYNIEYPSRRTIIRWGTDVKKLKYYPKYRKEFTNIGRKKNILKLLEKTDNLLV